MPSAVCVPIRGSVGWSCWVRPIRARRWPRRWASTRRFISSQVNRPVSLARQWKALEEKLATPACEFGILAGGRGTAKGYNPWLGQDNDMVVSVESTRLPGATDFAVLPVLHTLMMDDATVQQYTLNFLRHGYFVAPDERHPISPEPANRS